MDCIITLDTIPPRGVACRSGRRNRLPTLLLKITITIDHQGGQAVSPASCLERNQTRGTGAYTEDVKSFCMLALALALMTGCGGPAPGPSFDSAAEEFVYGTLALSPVSATQS